MRFNHLTCLIASFLSVLINGGAMGQTKRGQDDFSTMYVPLKCVDHTCTITSMTTGKLVKAENDLVQIASPSGKLMGAKINDQTVICISNDKKSVKELQALIGQSVSVFIHIGDMKEPAVLVMDRPASMTIKMKSKAADGTTADVVWDPIPCLQ